MLVVLVRAKDQNGRRQFVDGELDLRARQSRLACKPKRQSQAVRARRGFLRNASGVRVEGMRLSWSKVEAGEYACLVKGMARRVRDLAAQLQVLPFFLGGILDRAFHGHQVAPPQQRVRMVEGYSPRYFARRIKFAVLGVINVGIVGMREIIAVGLAWIAPGPADHRKGGELHVVKQAAAGIPQRHGVMIHFRRRSFEVARRSARAEHGHLLALQERRRAGCHHGNGDDTVRGNSHVVA